MMQSSRLALTMAWLGLFLTGCDLPERVDSQAERLAELETEVMTLKITSGALELMVDALRERETSTRSTELSLDGGAQPVEGWAGSLLVSWDDIQASGDGSRVSLRVGNPTLGTMEGLNIDASWTGGAAGSTSAKVPETLRPGVWNKVAFRLPGVKPDQVKTLSVSITVDTVAFKSM